MWKFLRKNCLTGGRIFESDDGRSIAYEIIDQYQNGPHYSLYIDGAFMGFLADLGSAP